MPGISIFLKDDTGAIYHTYSTYGRGLDLMNTAYNYLDLMPKGRNEDGLKHPMSWLRHHVCLAVSACLDREVAERSDALREPL